MGLAEVALLSWRPPNWRWSVSEHVEKLRDQDERIRQRRIGRTRAETIAELILSELQAPDMTDRGRESFWDSFLAFISENAPNHTNSNRPTEEPMSDHEANIYGSQPIGFGKYACDERREQLRYLDWLLGEKENEARHLRRYLQNEKIAERLRLEVERE